MILTDRQIKQAQEESEIEIKPFETTQVEAASYDFRVGSQGATTTSRKLVNIKNDGYLLLNPGDFGVVTVFEEIRLGAQYAARFGLRSKYARKGLIATTGPQIDPGFHGRLIVGVTNLTPRPISLPYKDDFVTVEFHKLEEPSSSPYSGPYQGKMELGPEEIEMITENEGMALSEVLTTLRSLTQEIDSLSTSVKVITWAVPIIVGLGITIIGIIVSVK